MFLAGMILGMLMGVLLIKLHNFMNAADSKAKQFADDAKETYNFWKEKRKANN
jgi:hypothetical protein